MHLQIRSRSPYAMSGARVTSASFPASGSRRFACRRFGKHPSLSLIEQYFLVWGIPVGGGIATARNAAITEGGLPGGSRGAPCGTPLIAGRNAYGARHDDPPRDGGFRP